MSSHPQQSAEHPFLTAVRLAARVGAPHFYADPELVEPVVVLPLRQYRALVEGGGGGAEVQAPVVPSPVVSVVPESDPEVSFDPFEVARVITQTEQEMAKNRENSRPWRPIAERADAGSAEEEGFYLHPVPRRSGL